MEWNVTRTDSSLTGQCGSQILVDHKNSQQAQVTMVTTLVLQESAF